MKDVSSNNKNKRIMDKELYAFGYKAVTANSTIVENGFEVYKAPDNENNSNNYNPYNNSYFDRPENNCSSDHKSPITSIPSPYARMHITDLAFYELTKGRTLLTQNQDKNSISFDYSKSLSHCLDVFELIFNSNTMDLAEKGIEIKKINLVTPDELSKIVEKIKEETGKDDVEKNNTELLHYLETLELYRNVYLNKIRTEKDKNSIKYYFDFSALYIKGFPLQPLLLSLVFSHKLTVICLRWTLN